MKVQQQLMVRAGEPHLGLIATAQAINRAGGPLLIMRGTCATAIRDGSSFGIYFGSYELCKTELSRAWGRPAGEPVSEAIMLTAGGAAGLLSWALALPADVIKSVVQGSPVTAPRAETTVPVVVRRLYRSGGIAAFYR